MTAPSRVDLCSIWWNHNLANDDEDDDNDDDKDDDNSNSSNNNNNNNNNISNNNSTRIIPFPSTCTSRNGRPTFGRGLESKNIELMVEKIGPKEVYKYISGLDYYFCTRLAGELSVFNLHVAPSCLARLAERPLGAGLRGVRGVWVGWIILELR